MPKHILVIDGHPDPDPARFGHALAKAYADGARQAGHDVRLATISAMDVPVLRSAADWEHGETSAQMRAAQDTIGWAQHVVLIYPLWLGALPALTKAFLEQVLRPGFAIAAGERSLWPGLLTGRSARIVVTMGMPAFVYRWFFFAHSLKSLERNILKFCGFGPIRETLIGGVGAASQAQREGWLKRMSDLGKYAR